jgi:TAG lipase/steryl ester hydrolase/phospholipase A2/LPA acyltransferase
MVFLEHLQKTSLLCTDDGKVPNQLPNDKYTALIDSKYNEVATFRRLPVSTQPWTLLGPAARIVRGSIGMVNNALRQFGDGMTEDERNAKSKKEERRQILSLRLKNAETMDNWVAAAKELDILEDNETWKYDNNSNDFDADLVAARTRELDEARINCDVKKMLYLVRTALSRDLGGMGNIKLYKHSHIGTKDLIERYIDSTLDTIRALVETSKYSLPDGLEQKDILEQVVYARQAFGRSALLLSGGAIFGMNHVGVLKALFEAKLLPRIISGASAGSIVCAILCTRTDDEIPEVLRKFPHGDLAVFEEAGNEDGILQRVQRLLTEGAWIDIKHLTRVMRELLGDMTFQEAYNRTRRILNICVSSASVYELPRLLNYVTAPNVMIWSAVAASCSVPLLFSAAQLLVKNPITGENTPWNPTPQRWIDGSVDNDLPMTRLAEIFNVNHFIVSQVNPHVVPFLAKDDQLLTKEAQSSSSSGWVYALTNLAKHEALHRMHVLAELGIFPNLVSKCRSILSQKYSGDITILPEINFQDFPRILKNPTTDYMFKMCLCGEKATWPRLSRVRNHCAVELELDVAVQLLRTRVVFSPSQVDLRRMETASFRGATGLDGKGTDRKNGVELSNHTSGEYHDGDFDLQQPNTSGTSVPIRAASTTWNTPRRFLPSLITAAKSSHHLENAGSHRSRLLPSHNRSFSLKTSNIRIFDQSLASKPSYTPPSSDGDVESCTDDDNSQMDMNVLDEPVKTQVQGHRRHSFAAGHDEPEGDREIDFFSSSRPITSGTDHILATTPTLTHSYVASSPAANETNVWNQDKRGSAGPSSPEKIYKRI